MNITILGAGAGGLAAAFDCAVHGHSVRLFDFPQFPVNIEAVVGQGGIHAEGDISGFGPVAYAGHDIDKALEDAELIYVIGPAFSTLPFGEGCCQTKSNSSQKTASHSNFTQHKAHAIR